MPPKNQEKNKPDKEKQTRKIKLKILHSAKASLLEVNSSNRSPKKPTSNKKTSLLKDGITSKSITFPKFCCLFWDKINQGQFSELLELITTIKFNSIKDQEMLLAAKYFTNFIANADYQTAAKFYNEKIHLATPNNGYSETHVCFLKRLVIRFYLALTELTELKQIDNQNFCRLINDILQSSKSTPKINPEDLLEDYLMALAIYFFNGQPHVADLLFKEALAAASLTKNTLCLIRLWGCYADLKISSLKLKVRNFNEFAAVLPTAAHYLKLDDNDSKALRNEKIFWIFKITLSVNPEIKKAYCDFYKGKNFTTCAQILLAQIKSDQIYTSDQPKILKEIKTNFIKLSARYKNLFYGTAFRLIFAKNFANLSATKQFAKEILDKICQETISNSPTLKLLAAQIIETYSLIGDQQSALTISNKQISNIDLNQPNQIVSNTLYRCGEILYANKNFDDAIDLLRQSVKIDEEIGHPLESARKLGLLAEVIFYNQLARENWVFSSNIAEEPLLLIERSEKLIYDNISLSNDMPNLLIPVLILKGQIKQAIGSQIEAIKAFDKARTLAEAIGDRLKVNLIFAMLGNAYSELAVKNKNLFGEANSFLIQALAFFEASKLYKIAWRVAYNLALLSIQQSSRIVSSEQTLALISQANDWLIRAYSFALLGKNQPEQPIYFCNQNLDESIIFYLGEKIASEFFADQQEMIEWRNRRQEFEKSKNGNKNKTNITAKSQEKPNKKFRNLLSLKLESNLIN
ncbi:MAG TPA: hypothetical protein PKD37_02185 [Oligoflexia bacterium]|nr:hypothetical protein [Oligoflexia bacterium]HMP26780.1 hypothetical protein [Oligoflexia bacterium]